MNDEQGRNRGALIGIALIAMMVLLIALAVGAQRTGFVALLLVTVVVAVVCVRAALPAAPLLWITFGICVPLYTAAYATMLTTLYRGAALPAVYLGYLLPLVAFVGATFWRRAAIAQRLATLRPGHRPRLAGGMAWLGLTAALGLGARAFMPAPSTPAIDALGLLLVMLAAGVLVVVFILDIATLLTETGTLFRAFATRMARRLVPIFSFVVVFVFVVVVFASGYAVLDRFAGVANFSVGGEARALNFAEAIYFSFVTLSTIGYGDITPLTHIARVIVVGEVVFGVVLMLFAFAEIAAYDPDAQAREDSGAG
ncbi:MAG: potassium channel family protein [Burkholderiales bacterium]|nr:potassium channel family protein [Burkholderiales bacterium]